MNHVFKTASLGRSPDQLATDLRKAWHGLADDARRAAQLAADARQWTCDQAILDAMDAASAAADKAADVARLAADAGAVAAAAAAASAARQAAAAAWDAFDAAVAAGGGQVPGRMPAGGAE